MGEITFSQCGEDIIINFLFKDMLNINDVTYLDIGANDPAKYNNTFYFYKSGFRGVSIDANSYFKKPFKKERPGDKFISAGIGPVDGKANFYVIDPHTLSTFSEKEAKKYTSTGLHKIVEIQEKEILSIGNILKKYFKKKYPNFLSIDVEGYDLEIIKSIDFTKWRPAVICAETLTYTTDSSEKKIKNILSLLKKNNYRIYADTYINTVFVDNTVWENRK